MNWQQILKSIGWPTTALVLDYESYWDKECTLSELSYPEYVNHPKFHLMGCGMFESKQPFDDPHNCSYWYPDKLERGFQRLQEEYGEHLEGCVVVGQNLMFDAYILKNIFGILPRYTIDTVCLARIQDSRRRNHLKNLCQIYDLPIQKGDNAWTKGRTWDSLSVEEQGKLAEYGRTDIETETLLFRKLLELVPNPELEIPLQHQTLMRYLISSLSFDFDLASEIRKGMRAELAEPLRKIGWIRKFRDKKKYKRMDILRSAKFVKALKEAGADVPMKANDKGQPIPALAKTDPGLQDLLNSPIEAVRDLCTARLAAKSWPTWIKRIDSMTNQAECHDGKLGMPLLYHGAHTGRDSGTQNINMQNLPGAGRAGAGTHPVLQKIRHCIRAGEGETIAIADLAQIEARIVAWLAGQIDLIEGFAKGEDVYSKFATTLFQCPVRKARKTDPPPVKKLLTIKRGFGKDGILGAGFGMGYIKLYDRCYSNLDLRPAFDSGEYDKAFIKQLINTYRSTYARIPEFWNNIEKMFRWVTKYHNQVYGYKILDQECMCNTLVCYEPGLNFWFDEKWNRTVIQLPSGRELYYPQARVGKDNSIKDHYSYWWGGSLTENVVQSIARDLFMISVLELEKQRLPVVLRAHDEVVCLISKKGGQKTLNKIIDIMRQVPAWAKNLPVDAEGFLSEYYRK